MRDFQFNLLDNDIVFTTDLKPVYGIESIKQAVFLSIRLFLADWFLDLDLGTDYYGQILVKNPNLVAVKEIFKQRILAVQGVTSVLFLRLNLDRIHRVLSVDFSAQTNLGLLEGSVIV